MDSNTVILAILMKKFHSVFCRYDSSSKLYEFSKVSTFRKCFRESLLGKPCPRVVVEACLQAYWVSSAVGDPWDSQVSRVADPGKEIPQRPGSPSTQAFWGKLGFFFVCLLLKSVGPESG